MEYQKRKKYFFGKKKRKSIGIRKGDQAVRIGIIGSSRAVGTTFLSLQMGTFFSLVCGYKSAVVELTDHKDFIRICSATGNEKNNIFDFVNNRLRYVSGSISVEKKTYIEDICEIVVYDCGSAKEGNLDCFLECDVRILVCSSLYYKRKQTERLISELGDIEYELFAMLPDPAYAKYINKYYKRVINSLVPAADPLKLSSDTVRQFNNIFHAI